MSLQWRTLDFFESAPVDEGCMKQYSISCSAPLGLFFGTKDGWIVQADQSWRKVLSWQAYNGRVTHIIQGDRLATIGIDDVSTGLPILKIWDLEKISNNTPTMIKSINVQQGSKIFPVTTIAIVEKLNLITIGLENGVVLLLKGDISSKQNKISVIYEESTPITGLAIVNSDSNPFLYIVSYNRISVVSLVSGKEIPKVLDDGVGCEIGNSLLTPVNYPPEMVLARREALYFYGKEGRGPCFIISGEKTIVVWYRSYLVVVTTVVALDSESPLTMSSAPSVSPTSTLLPFGTNLPGGTLLSIYDLKTKLIAYRSSFGEMTFDQKCGQMVGEEIIRVLIGPSELLVVTKTNKVFRVVEKDLETRLDSLYSQNLYNLAINMVSSASVNTFHSKDVDEKPQTTTDHASRELIMEIHKRFADFLYSKSEYSSSVNHYIRTITHLSPSYVILKYVDPSHIVHLTTYLQALHDSKISTESHTSLLLNCYSKLKDEENINKLVSQGGFNIENGIRICKTGGYFKQALDLAKKALLHDWVINILFDDLNDPAQVISYIAQLEPNSIVQTFKKYGSTLVKHLPKESTDILVFLCTIELQVYPEEFIPFYVDSRSWCIEFLERVLSTRFNDNNREFESKYQKDQESISRSAICNSLFELYLESYGMNNDNTSNIWEEKCLNLLKAEQNGIDVDHALILCKRHNLRSGILHILEINSRYEDILEFYDQQKNYDTVLATCRTNESQYPKIWIKAFKLLISSSSIDESKIVTVIKEVDRLNLLSPLEIIQLLSSNKGITLGLIKDFIIEKINIEKELIDKSFNETQQYQSEIEEMAKQIQYLTSETVVFQSSRCEFCRQILEVPATHFLCKHSYHQRCLGQSQDECPRCSPERRILQDVIRDQHQSSANHSEFLKNLESSTDLFSYIVDCYSKNVFSNDL